MVVGAGPRLPAEPRDRSWSGGEPAVDPIPRLYLLLPLGQIIKVLFPLVFSSAAWGGGSWLVCSVQQNG